MTTKMMSATQVATVVKSAKAYDLNGVSTLRSAYAAMRDAIAHDCNAGEWGATVRKMVAAEYGMFPCPEDFVTVANVCRVHCPRCAGTGKFITMVENGVPKGPGGDCFRCEGRGSQGWRDGYRNRGYDNGMFVRAIAEMMGSDDKRD